MIHALDSMLMLCLLYHSFITPDNVILTHHMQADVKYHIEKLFSIRFQQALSISTIHISTIECVWMLLKSTLILFIRLLMRLHKQNCLSAPTDLRFSFAFFFQWFHSDTNSSQCLFGCCLGRDMCFLTTILRSILLWFLLESA